MGDPFDAQTQMGPLVAERQRDRVEGYIAKGVAEGATLATGGGRPAHLDRGWFIEPTVFGNVDNSSTIAQEEIFGPVLSVIPAQDEAARHRHRQRHDLRAQRIGLHQRRRTGPATWPASCAPAPSATTPSVPTSASAFGGFKQSGIGREGGTEGLLPFLETKTVILEGRPGLRTNMRRA